MNKNPFEKKDKEDKYQIHESERLIIMNKIKDFMKKKNFIHDKKEKKNPYLKNEKKNIETKPLNKVNYFFKKRKENKEKILLFKQESIPLWKKTFIWFLNSFFFYNRFAFKRSWSISFFSNIEEMHILLKEIYKKILLIKEFYKEIPSSNKEKLKALSIFFRKNIDLDSFIKIQEQSKLDNKIDFYKEDLKEMYKSLQFIVTYQVDIFKIIDDLKLKKDDEDLLKDMINQFIDEYFLRFSYSLLEIYEISNFSLNENIFNAINKVFQIDSKIPFESFISKMIYLKENKQTHPIKKNKSIIDIIQVPEEKGFLKEAVQWIKNQLESHPLNEEYKQEKEVHFLEIFFLIIEEFDQEFSFLITSKNIVLIPFIVNNNNNINPKKELNELYIEFQVQWMSFNHFFEKLEEKKMNKESSILQKMELAIINNYLDFFLRTLKILEAMNREIREKNEKIIQNPLDPLSLYVQDKKMNNLSLKETFIMLEKFVQLIVHILNIRKDQL